MPTSPPHLDPSESDVTCLLRPIEPPLLPSDICLTAFGSSACPANMETFRWLLACIRNLRSSCRRRSPHRHKQDQKNEGGKHIAGCTVSITSITDCLDVPASDVSQGWFKA